MSLMFNQWRGNVFLNRGAENIKYKFRFAPQFAKHLHQPVISMAAGSCTFASH